MGQLIDVLVENLEYGQDLFYLKEVNGVPVNVVINDEKIAKDLAEKYDVVVLHVNIAKGDVGYKIDNKTAKLVGVDTHHSVIHLHQKLKGMVVKVDVSPPIDLDYFKERLRRRRDK